MAKYIMTIEIEAEQFLPEEDKIPKGVTSDGPRSPRTDPRAAWVLRTPEETIYLKSGDYIITTASGAHYRVEQSKFERDYKLIK